MAFPDSVISKLSIAKRLGGSGSGGPSGHAAPGLRHAQFQTRSNSTLIECALFRLLVNSRRFLRSREIAASEGRTMSGTDPEQATAARVGPTPRSIRRPDPLSVSR